MNRTHRRLIVALAAALAATALVAASAQAAALPKLLTDNGGTASSFKVRAKSILLTADGADIIGNAKQGLKWSSWTATGATGTGKQYINDCEPNCASGKTTAYPLSIRASAPKKVHGVLAFTRVAFTYTGKLPAKTRRTWSLKLTWDGKTFGWS